MEELLQFLNDVAPGEWIAIGIAVAAFVVSVFAVRYTRRSVLISNAEFERRAENAVVKLEYEWDASRSVLAVLNHSDDPAIDPIVTLTVGSGAPNVLHVGRPITKQERWEISLANLRRKPKSDSPMHIPPPLRISLRVQFQTQKGNISEFAPRGFFAE